MWGGAQGGAYVEGSVSGPGGLAKAWGQEGQGEYLRS